MKASFLAVFVASAFAGLGCNADLGSSGSTVDISQFVLPSLSTADREEIVQRYDFLDPEDEVPRGLLEDAIIFFDVNQALIPKSESFVVIDLSKFSGEDRFWIVDLWTGAVEKHKTAHGSGSDPDHDGYADTFSNVSGSLMSSLGFYLTGEIYDGTHIHSMKLDGLSPDGSPNDMANTNARDRAIVVHEAGYVSDSNTGIQGRSSGCPALDPSVEVSVVDRIYGGSLTYIAISPLDPPVGRAASSSSDPGEDLP
jgi:hypothetical protein